MCPELTTMVINERQVSENAHALQDKIDALAREIADTINVQPADEREVLREFAVNLLRDQVRGFEPTRSAVGVHNPTGSFNPFGIAIPLVLMGSVLVFLFPLVGLLMFGAAAVMIAWGVGVTLLAPR